MAILVSELVTLDRYQKAIITRNYQPIFILRFFYSKCFRMSTESHIKFNENIETVPSSRLSRLSISSVSTITSINTANIERRRKKKKTREVSSRYLQSLNTNSNANENAELKPTEDHEIKKRESINKSSNFISKKPYSRPSVLNKRGRSILNPEKQKLVQKRREEILKLINQVNVKTTGSNQSTINSDDELIMLNARLMQWCFLNAKAEHAFDCQKRTVETQLVDAWELLMRKQNEMLTLRRKFALEKEIIELDRTLKSQVTSILQINQHLEHFKARYLAFATALASTTTAMPITNILTGEFEHLMEEINECSNALDETLQSWGKESSTIHNIANLIYKLCINIKEEIQELNECNSLLQEISEAEILETSLRIQKIEISND